MTPNKKEHLTNLAYAGITLSTIAGFIGFYHWMDSIGAIPIIATAVGFVLALFFIYWTLYFIGWFVRNSLQEFREIKERNRK